MANARHYHNVFVLTTVSCLAPIASFVTEVNRRNQLRALFVRFDDDAAWLPQMFEQAKLRTMRNTFAHSDFIVPQRVLRAWQLGAQDALIADARVIGDALYVLSCVPESYKIPFDSIPRLKTLSPHERSTFVIPGDGSYIHWPGPDIHLDLDALLTAIDPERRAKAERSKRSYGQDYGSAIARLRHERGLKQTDIEGLSDREVRRIEAQGEVTSESLKKLAAAHEMSPAEYMAAVAEFSLELHNSPAPRLHSPHGKQVRKKK